MDAELGPDGLQELDFDQANNEVIGYGPFDLVIDLLHICGGPKR